MDKKDPAILFLYPHPARETLQDVQAGRAPSERMYGLIELRKRGWSVDFCDARFEGRSAGMIAWLEKRGIRLINWSTVKAIRSHDIIVVKDAFSTMTTLVARLFGKKVIYMDSMFAVPQRAWRRIATSINLRLATATLCYSQTQMQLWMQEFGLRKPRLIKVPYAIDTDFYKPLPPTAPARPYVLSVGRDLGRDFATLLRAMEGSSLELKLITLPYLLPPAAKHQSGVEIIERIPYAQLFELYAGACAAVIPLSSGITYPSGIRAAMEAIVLGTPTIVTRTEILEEYIQPEENIMLVAAENAAQLRQAIDKAYARWSGRHPVDAAKLDGLRQRYGMDTFVDAFETLLRSMGFEKHPGRSSQPKPTF